ncbi:MAG TPA: hypothetical protein VIN59_09410 [Alphaproteobacteria bacterium]
MDEVLTRALNDFIKVARAEGLQAELKAYPGRIKDYQMLVLSGFGFEQDDFTKTQSLVGGPITKILREESPFAKQVSILMPDCAGVLHSMFRAASLPTDILGEEFVVIESATPERLRSAIEQMGGEYPDLSSVSKYDFKH